MPANNLASTAQPSAAIQQARWICGPRGCFWRPNVFIGPGIGWRRPIFNRWGLGTAWLEMAARLAPLVSAPSGPALAQ
jgi:hypothetical protein